MIWKRKFDLERLNTVNKSSLVDHLGIQFSEYGDDFLEATMPVDQRTIQPYGILHGGASVALAETIGSVASSLCIGADESLVPVGIDINATHLKSVSRGRVTGRATPVRIGKTMHVWNIEIRNDKNELTCTSRITIKIIERR